MNKLLNTNFKSSKHSVTPQFGSGFRQIVPDSPSACPCSRPRSRWPTQPRRPRQRRLSEKQLISQQVSQKRLKLKVIPPLFFEFQKLMASSKTFSILKYIVLGLPKTNFRSIRAWQHPSTSADISTQGLGENFAICRFSTYKHHHELPVNGGILIYVSHLVLWRPS